MKKRRSENIGCKAQQNADPVRPKNGSDMPFIQQYMEMYMYIFVKGNRPKILSHFQHAWGGGERINRPNLKFDIFAFSFYLFTYDIYLTFL